MPLLPTRPSLSEGDYHSAVITDLPVGLPLRSQLLPRLFETHERDGFLNVESVAVTSAALQMPLAEAWEAATAYPDFAIDAPHERPAGCSGLSCVLNGALAVQPGRGSACRFRCYDAPADAADAPFPETALGARGPLLAPDLADWRGLEAAQAEGREAALARMEAAGLRGRGGAYFAVATKWRAALAEERPIALVVNAEEGEPGIFKDRALLGLRPRRFVEGLAIAAAVLEAEIVIVFINGEARAARASLEAALAEAAALFSVPVEIVTGGGGYVLGEETTLLNALEGRKPVPRLRPPYPVESGLFGMPTVVNNVETLAALSPIFREGVDSFRSAGPADAPGTKLFSVSGNVREPGVYELPLGTSVGAAIAAAGAPPPEETLAALVGGPSGGFLPPAEFDTPLLPGRLHETGAVTGSGGIIVLDEAADLRGAALAMSAYNALESCGKCTPCREGSPRADAALEAGGADDLPDLLEALEAGSLCGLGAMAPGPIRSALHFWPERFS